MAIVALRDVLAVSRPHIYPTPHLRSRNANAHRCELTMSFIAPLPLTLPRTRSATSVTSLPPSGYTRCAAAEVERSDRVPVKRKRSHVSSSRVRALFQRAKVAQGEGRHSYARTLLKQCLELDVRDAHSWLALANLETRHTTVDVARGIFRRGLKHCPENVHLLQAFGVLEHRAGDRDAARRLFAQGFQADPSNPYVAQAWGLLEERVGNKNEARRLFSSSVENRGTPEVYMAWALLEAREGNTERARELLRNGIATCRSASQRRSKAGLLRQWAQLEERLGDLPRARQLLSDAIAAAPRASEAYVTLAQLEARRGSTKQALALIAVAASLAKLPPPSVYMAWAHIEWHHCGNVDEARRVLHEGADRHPRDHALLQTLGDLEHKCGNSGEARALLEKSVSTRPNAPAYVTWALVEEAQGSIIKAAELFERAIAAEPSHGVSYNAYGAMMARHGDVPAARAVYERGLRAAPCASVWHGYGLLEMKHGASPERAIDLFREGTERAAEETAFVWHSWGMLELSLKRVTDARQVFANALRLYPRNSRLLVGAAWAASAAIPGSSKTTRGQEPEARSLFKRAVAADPTHAQAWQAWAVFELRYERFDAAEALFRRGLRMCPNHGALWQAWGVLQSEQGNFVRARSIFRRGANASQGNVHLYQAWACMEVRCGNLGRARELLEQALVTDRTHGPVWTAYGLLEARHGTPQMARKLFRRGIDLAPVHAPLYRTFGETEARLGNYEYARKLYRDGIRIDPWHAPLYHALAKMEAMLGNIDALAELRRQAERRFGSAEQAEMALDQGGLRDEVRVHVGVQVDEAEAYEALRTPMQQALDYDPPAAETSGSVVDET